MRSSRAAPTRCTAWAKYTFVTAIEACVDVAQHICASEGWGPPADNGDALTLLGRTACWTRSWPAAFGRRSGSANVLVHAYVRVDDHIVTHRLADPSDLAEFVTAVADWTATDG